MRSGGETGLDACASAIVGSGVEIYEMTHKLIYTLSIYYSINAQNDPLSLYIYIYIYMYMWVCRKLGRDLGFDRQTDLFLQHGLLD